MTLTDATNDVVATEPATATTVPTPAAPRPGGVRRRVVAITAILLTVCAVAWVVFALFEGPVATTWYHSRQRALTADYKSAHAHSGLGHAIAVLQIPRLDVNVVVAEGASREQLRGGPGHDPATAAPVAVGNAVILGHRDAWGGPFRRLHELKPNDFIVVQVQTRDGLEQDAVYKVLRTEQVAADDAKVFAPARDYRLTLLTGDGSRRLAITAVSGTVLGPTSASRAAATDVPAPRVTTTPTTVRAAVGFVGALFVWLLLRRRYHRAIVLVAMAPLVLLGTLGTVLSADLLLPPLR